MVSRWSAGSTIDSPLAFHGLPWSPVTRNSKTLLRVWPPRVSFLLILTTVTVRVTRGLRNPLSEQARIMNTFIVYRYVLFFSRGTTDQDGNEARHLTLMVTDPDQK